MSAARRVLSAARARAFPASSSRPLAIDSRVLARASRSRRAASISDFNCGMRELRTVAARTACAMSSGLTRMAGGGLLPIRCRAASTSAITPRRRSSEAESSSAVAFRLANLSAASAAPRSASCTLAVVSMSAAERRARSAPNGLDFGLDRPALFLRLAQRVLDAAQLDCFVRALLVGRRGRGGGIGKGAASQGERSGQCGRPRAT